MTSRPATTKLVLKITSFILRLLLNIIFYTVVVMLIISVSRQTYQFCYQIFGQVTASEAPGRDIEIQVKQGESTMNVASKLELNKVIVNKYSFYLKAKLKKYNIMPGTFIVNTSMTYDEIFAIITVPLTEETEEDSKTDGTGASVNTDTKDQDTDSQDGDEDSQDEGPEDGDTAE